MRGCPSPATGWPISESDRMRIFIVTQTFLPQTGGMEAVMAALAEKFAAAGHAVTVLPDKPYDVAVGYRIVQQSALKFRRAALKRRFLAGCLKPDDIIICDSWKSVGAVPPHDGRLVVLAHGQEYLKTGRRARRVQKALDRATHLVASSAYTLRLAENGWQTDHIAKQVIPPTYMLADAAAEPAARTDGPLQLLSICRLEARKGLLPSLEALAALGSAVPAWQWTIGGNGPQRDELEKAAARLGLQDRVRFAGFVDEPEKQALLAAADLFVMPSYRHGSSLEGFGIAYAEAARFGVPSVAGTAGGAPEAVRHGETGWCVDPLDAAALSSTLQTALSDHDASAARGMAARENFVDRLAGGKAFAGFMALIESREHTA